ncbi:hypothetical protein PG984_012054 [Apiospora sp. TS-2023a]
MSPLEGLPAELRSLLLWNVPDLTTLRSLVHASPVLHAQYCSDRDGILRACLGRDMDGFFKDAWATAMSHVSALGSPRTNQNITEFLNSTYDVVFKKPDPDITSLSSGCLYSMVAFHTSVAGPLANLYARWALANIAEAASSSSVSVGPQAASAAQTESSDLLNLSRSEEVRICRAIYRHETFYNLFGRHAGRNDSTFATHEVLGLFFYNFDPWESEAIWCINVFLERAYETIFDPIRHDIEACSPRLKQMTSRPGLEDVDEEPKDSAFTRAPPLQLTDPAEVRSAARQLFESSSSRTQPVEAAHDNTDVSMPSVLSQESSHSLRAYRRFDDPHAWWDPREEAEERRDPVEFLGDDAASLATDERKGPGSGPPIAWVRLWNGHHSNLYGENVPPSPQRWGYVMWDARRWEELGTLGLVAEQWEAVPDVVEWIENMYNWSPTWD